jgi:NADP-dependent 3-hydroxy acid dehydrogenase YdfG
MSLDPHVLAGQAAIVVGAASGIGSAIAIRFAEVGFDPTRGLSGRIPRCP